MTALRQIEFMGPTVTSGLHHLRDLPNLTVFDAQCTFFPNDELPADMAHLTRLTRLSLLHTTIRDGWQHLLPLQQRLESLSLTTSSTAYGPMPAQLSSLTRLTSLTLYRTRPRWECMPPKLCSLAIGYRGTGGFRRISPSISSLTDLRSLYIQYSAITDGWQHLPHQLEDLDINECAQSEVPARVSALTQLTRLSLSHNPILDGWQHLRPLQRLRDIALVHCELTDVPWELASLTQLTSADLACNPIRSGLQHLPVQLRYLDLSYCGLRGLSGLPGQLSHLTQLIQLDIKL